jgi:hypothetical protein
MLSKCFSMFQRAKQLSAISYVVITHVERAFAAFAKVPYLDAPKQREFNHMYSELNGSRRGGSIVTQTESPEMRASNESGSAPRAMDLTDIPIPVRGGP